MFLKVNVTLLLFIIHTAIEARFLGYIRPTVYSVAIEGKLRCHNGRKGFALVMISNNNRPHVDKNPIAKHYAEFNLRFFLSKMFKYRGKQPHLFVKIFYRCKPYKEDIYERMFLREIPRPHVMKGTRKNIYNLGDIELFENRIKTKTRVGVLYGSVKSN